MTLLPRASGYASWRRRTGIEPAGAFVTRPTALKAAAGTSRQTPPARTLRQSSADLHKMFAAGDELANDRRARNLACHQQTPGRLGICEQESLKFIDFRKIGARPHPVQVPAGTAADEPVRRRLGGAVEVGQ